MPSLINAVATQGSTHRPKNCGSGYNAWQLLLAAVSTVLECVLATSVTVDRQRTACTEGHSNIATTRGPRYRGSLASSRLNLTKHRAKPSSASNVLAWTGPRPSARSVRFDASERRGDSKPAAVFPPLPRPSQPLPAGKSSRSFVDAPLASLNCAPAGIRGAASAIRSTDAARGRSGRYPTQVRRCARSSQFDRSCSQRVHFFGRADLCRGNARTHTKAYCVYSKASALAGPPLRYHHGRIRG